VDSGFFFVQLKLFNDFSKRPFLLLYCLCPRSNYVVDILDRRRSAAVDIY